MTADSGSEDTDTSFRIIETTVIPEVTHVRLYQDTIDKVVEEHEFGEGLTKAPVNMIEDTVKNPTAVYASTGYPTGNYIYSSTSNTFEGNPCNVPVKVVEGTSARVKTAIFTERPKGTLIWKGASDDNQ